MRFALAGAGSIGAIRAQALALTPSCDLTGIFDLDPARAKVVASAARAYRDYDELLRAADVDAVIVSTPPNTHEDYAIRALTAGKHVLIEKPMAPTPDACRRIIAAARQAGKLATTGYNHRYFAATKLVRDIVRSGEIGTLSHVRGFTGHAGLAEFKAAWMYDADVMGGGAMMDNGTHMIDLVRYIMGDAEEVFGIASNRVWNLPRVEDHAVVTLRSASGVVGTVEASWDEWKGYRFHLEAYGDKGMARAHYAPLGAVVIRQDKPGGARKVTRHWYPATIVREKLKGWQSTVIQTFVEEFTDFAAMAADRAVGTRIATAFDGFRAVEIAHAVYACSASGTPTRLATQASV